MLRIYLHTEDPLFTKWITKVKLAIILVEVHSQFGENPLRCTTQDKKGLVLATIFFYHTF
jgi:hypothetical protein